MEHLGLAIHPWTLRETAARVEACLDAGTLVRHGSINVAKVVRARRDPALRRHLRSCEVLTADGAGVVWGARALGTPLPERVAGIDLFAALVALAARRGEPVFLYGARPRILERACAALCRMHPGLILGGRLDGYGGDDRAALEAVAASGATMLFVALDTPRKERVVHAADRASCLRFAMGVGGALDVIAGRRRRAPVALQRTGLEWAFRMAQEPRRLGPRYLTTNAAYAALIAREVARKVARSAR